MASAQILQLYYTKDNKSQQENQSKFHHQRSKPVLQGQQPITIPRKQLQELPQNNSTLSKLTEHFYCFQSTNSDTNNSNTTDSWHQLQHHKSLPTNNIEKSVSKGTTTTRTASQQPSASSFYSATKATDKDHSNSNKDEKNIEEKDTTTKDHISKQRTCSRWKDIFNFPEDERPSPKDDASPAAITANALDDCEVSLVAYPGTVPEHRHGCRSSCTTSAESYDTAGATTRTMPPMPQQRNHMGHNAKENNHFQYKMCSALPSQPPSLSSSPQPQPQSSPPPPCPPLEFSNDGIGNSNNELAGQHTSSSPQRIDTFITGSHQKQSRGDTSKAKGDDDALQLRPVEGMFLCEGESATACVNFIAATIDGENSYATPTTTKTTTATTTTRKTKNCATCCQNNATSNTSVVIAGIDQTCFLQKRIDFYRKDSLTKANGSCPLCKCKPNTCQKSKSPECCKNAVTLPTATSDNYEQCNSNGANAKRLQSSNSTSTSDSSSSLLLQSTTSGSATTTQNQTTLSRLSSKQQYCCNKERRCALQQHSQQQRTTKFYNFDCQKCDKGKWSKCSPNSNTNTNSIYTNHSVNTNISTKSRLFTAAAPVDANRRFCRKLGEHATAAFADIQRFTRAILPLIIIFNILPLLYAECDQTFVSRVGGPQNGTFSAPLIHNPRNHSRQCLYIFLAGPGQRVEVVFTTFNLRGSPPDGSAVGELPTCVHEYMDIYSEVQSSDPADLINSPFGGRFCGTIPPRRRISMHRAIAISFFTNKNVSEPDLFEGHYRFLNASEYEIGIPIAGSPCSYTITPSMSINKTGALISPTYPGAYPKDMSCTYQFLGETNQRVRLEFRDFDLFFGGPHCPFDYVKVYDGPDNSSALIGTYCGQQRNLVLYSSESSLFVHFYTLPRTANTQNRGFKGIYEFSESFVKLDFIRENDGIHIRGSECDQKILSKKESTGFVLSPNYPYPYIPKTVCRYFIYGMQDAQHLERVRLEFSAFNIPKVENKDKSETNCSDGYLKIYLKGQETADAYDKFDHELCGNETQRVVSDGPRLAMVFSSGELQGRGFKGKYTFETEYKIPGTAAPDGTCSFTYVSSSKKRGELNSPRYPSNYPSETNCSYLFLAEPNEQVTIVFDHFKVKADNVNSTAGAYGASACFEDWLEMYVIYRDNNDRFLGRYCGLTAPGPVESPRGAVGLRITLHTDQENVASGFKARYYFEAAKSEVGDCGGNFSNEDSGIITSPLYPSNYKSPPKGLASMACNWYMTARPGYKLSINFEHFSVEGDPMARGCPAAVLRMWTNVDSEAAPIELCGEKPPTEHWHYMTTGQSARISFTTTDKTIGAQGFRIVWTEIQDSGPGPPAIGLLCESPYHFQCSIGYCISDKLRCDGTKNCGPGDDSDEMHCESYHGSSQRGSRRSNNGLSSSRRHLQSGGSLSGSLHGINSGTLIIPPAPLPPTSVPPPPHICLAGAGAMGGLGMGGIGSGMMIGVGLDDDDDNDDDEDNPDIFINDIRFDENNLDQLETV